MKEQIEALEYHFQKRPGKIELISSKPCDTAQDLSLAYTPGVGWPVLAIKENPREVYRYTAKGNLVGIITNATAVLGLGDVGPLAAKPVMEGKAVLFKKLADIDAFDIEIDEKDPDRLIQTIQAIAPTFGGINLEDIKAPECFFVENQLKARLPIPVFHDDQHGTAVVAGAALLNALQLVNKKISSIRIVICGAGAAAQACARFYIELGASFEQIWMLDSKGVLSESRAAEVHESQLPFLQKTSKRRLSEIIEGADVFLGLSGGNVLTGTMARKMAERPIIFALANPTPEIGYEEAKAACPNGIIATGRSDFPNQINNVLGFPFIFRGALDAEAPCINEPMKIAAAHALAKLAKTEAPAEVKKAYAESFFSFGNEYILPKPFDSRVLLWVAPAVAQAAVLSGISRKADFNLSGYPDELRHRMNNQSRFLPK